MIRVIGVLAGALALSGCMTAAQWQRPGATTADFDKDRLQCEYEARIATANSSGRLAGMGDAVASGIMGGMQKVELMTLCLQTKGWTRSG